jgi:LmbE family N-acetylglucosaminyl deacetylase
MSPLLAGGVAALPRRIYRGVRARRSAGEERRFETLLRHEPRAPALLLSPHLDDAVLDCWSLLAGAGELRVVNLFAGVPPPGRLAIWDAITGASDSATRMGERLAEDARALARAGVKPLNLQLLDTQYRFGVPPPRLDQLDRELAGSFASASRVFAPAGIGSHPDHLFSRRYARMLLRAGFPVTLYAELPYCILHGWPHWVEGREPEPNRDVDPFWLSFLEDVPEMPPLRSAHVERLDAASAAAKLEAMRSYETQFPALNYGARPVLEDPGIHSLEVRWELTAPVAGAHGASG